MGNGNIIFFRNDDVRSTLDESLVSLTDIFIRNGIPISHAVEPANISSDPKLKHFTILIRLVKQTLFELRK